MVKLTGKVKSFSISTRRICRECKSITKRKRGGIYLCPECGVLDWRKTRRVWFSRVSLDLFDLDVTAIFLERAVSQVANRLDMSWQMLLDRLKGLRGEVWLRTFLNIKREVEEKASEKLIGRVVTLHGSWIGKVFAVKKIGPSISAKPSIEGTRFVRAKLKELVEVTDSIMQGYEMEIELWGGIPVLRLHRDIKREEVEVGVRAPYQYGRSYRVWVRVNGVHMYPTRPVRTGKKTEAWVLRAYHTAGWKKKLMKILEHCKGLEDHTIRVVKAARRIDVQDAYKLLSPELSEDEKEEIIDKWNGGSLWDLAEETSKVNRTAGLFVLKKYGFLKEV